MIKRLRDYIDHAYFDSLRTGASKKFVHKLTNPNPDDFERSKTDVEKAQHTIVLVDAAEVYCGLSRRIAEDRLDEEQLIDCMRDYAELAVSFGRLLDSGEHELPQDTLPMLDKAAQLIRVRGQEIAANDPDAARRLEPALNVPFRGVDTWDELKQLVSGIREKHFSK